MVSSSGELSVAPLPVFIPSVSGFQQVPKTPSRWERTRSEVKSSRCCDEDPEQIPPPGAPGQASPAGHPGVCVCLFLCVGVCVLLFVSWYLSLSDCGLGNPAVTQIGLLEGGCSCGAALQLLQEPTVN